MRKLQQTLLVLCVTALTVGSVHAAQNCYVIMKGGNRFEGESITVLDRDGTIELKRDDTVRQFSKDVYKRAFMPKPKPVKDLQSAYEKKQFDKVLKYGPRIFEKYKFVGWGDLASYYIGMAQLNRGNTQQALETFNRGFDYTRANANLLRQGKIQALMKVGKIKEASRLTDKVIRNAKGADAAYAFNLSGQLLVKQGKKKEAVLEYLKTLLLFRGDQRAAKYREQAKKEAVQLLEEMNDPRVKKIRKLN